MIMHPRSAIELLNELSESKTLSDIKVVIGKLIEINTNMDYCYRYSHDEFYKALEKLIK